MRTLRYRATVPNATFAEIDAINLKVQEHSQITICALTASTNVQLAVKYVFTDDDNTETEADIQTVNLTAGTMTILNFDFKLGHIRITTDDVTGTPTGGAIRIDATTAK